MQPLDMSHYICVYDRCMLDFVEFVHNIVSCPLAVVINVALNVLVEETVFC